AIISNAGGNVSISTGEAPLSIEVTAIGGTAHSNGAHGDAQRLGVQNNSNGNTAINNSWANGDNNGAKEYLVFTLTPDENSEEPSSISIRVVDLKANEEAWVFVNDS